MFCSIERVDVRIMIYKHLYVLGVTYANAKGSKGIYSAFIDTGLIGRHDIECIDVTRTL